MGTEEAWRFALALTILVIGAALPTKAAPVSESTELESYDDEGAGCYYNFQHYGEGDRIMTNEPCLNCTCHNRMLMCYLRVCPFTKAIGQDCTVEKRADQCCPIITCPDVRVDLVDSTTLSSLDSTEVGHHDRFGCSINNRFYTEGAQVPSNPEKPCELCYCIRNMTNCVMQECTLHVEGCTPVYLRGVCCPVRYSCEHPEDDGPLMIEDATTTTVRPTPGFLLTTTAQPGFTAECTHNEVVYADGALIPTEQACEHCYCMKGDIVCAVQECGTPMENEGKNCSAVAPKLGQCCPDTYICEGDESSLSTIPESDSSEITDDRLHTVSPSTKKDDKEPVDEEQEKVSPQELDKDELQTEKPKQDELVTPVPEKEDKSTYTPDYEKKAQEPEKDALHTEKPDFDKTTQQEQEKDELHTQKPDRDEIITQEPEKDVSHSVKPVHDELTTQQPGKDDTEKPEDGEIVSQDLEKDILHPEKPDHDKIIPQEVEKDQKPDHDEKKPDQPEKDEEHTEKLDDKPQIHELHTEKPEHDEMIPQITEKDDFQTVKPVHGELQPQELEKDELLTEKPDSDKIIPKKPETDDSHTEKPDRDGIMTQEPDKYDLHTDKPEDNEHITQKPGKDDLHTPEGDEIVPQDLDKDKLLPEKPDHDEIVPQEPVKDDLHTVKPGLDESITQETGKYDMPTEAPEHDKPEKDDLHTVKPGQDEPITQETGKYDMPTEAPEHAKPEKDDLHTVKPGQDELVTQEPGKDEKHTEIPEHDKPEKDDLYTVKPGQDEPITQGTGKYDMPTEAPEHDKPEKDDLHTVKPGQDELVTQEPGKDEKHTEIPEHDKPEKDDLHTVKPGQDELVTQEPGKDEKHTEIPEHDKPEKDDLYTVKPGQDEPITQETGKYDMPTEAPEHDKPEKDDLHTVKPGQDEPITQETGKYDMHTEAPEHGKPEKDDLYTVKPGQDEPITQGTGKYDMPTEAPEHDKPEKDDLHTVKPGQDELVTQEPGKDEKHTEIPEHDKTPQDLEKDRLHPEKPGHDEVIPQEPEKDEEHTEKLDDKLFTQEPQTDDLHTEKDTEYPKEGPKQDEFSVEVKPGLDDKIKISTSQEPEYSQSSTQTLEDDEQKTTQTLDIASVKDVTTVRYHSDSLETTEHSSAEVTSHPPLDKVPQHRDDVSGELEHITEGKITPPKPAERDQHPSEEPQEHDESTTSPNAGDEIVTSGPSQTEQEVEIMDHVTDAHVTLMEQDKPLPTRFESNEDDQQTEKSTVLTDSGTTRFGASIDVTTESIKTSDHVVQHPEDDKNRVEPVSVTKHVDESSTSSLGHIQTSAEDHEESSGDSFLDIHQPTPKYGEEDGSGEVISKPKPTEKPIKRVEDVSESQEQETDKKASDILPDISHEFDSTEDKSAEDSSQKHDDSTTTLPEKDTRTTSPPIKSSSSESESESQEEVEKLHDVFSDDGKKSTEIPPETTNVDLSIFDDSTKRDDAHIHDRVSDDESSAKLDVPSTHTEKESQSTTVVSSLEDNSVSPSVEKEVTTKTSNLADVSPKEYEKTTVYPQEAVSEHDSEISHTEEADVHLVENEVSSDKPVHLTESPETVDPQTDEPVIQSKPDIIDSEKTEQETEIPVKVQQKTDKPVLETKPNVVENEIYSQKPEDITELPVNVHSQTEQPIAYTTQAAIQIVLDDSTTSRIEDQNVEVTTLREESTTTDHINEADNEIEGDIYLPVDYQPPRIPGEGDCMIDGKSYMNSHIIPTTNKCQTSCRCINSVVTCEHVKCSPPPANMKNCQAVYHTKEACCPMYTCEHEEPNAIESGNQMSQEYEDKDESHTTVMQHEIVEEPIVPAVYKPDCNEESGCEIQTKKPSDVIDEKDTEKQHGLVDTSPAIDKLESSDSTEKHDDEKDILVSTRQQSIETVTPSLVKETTASPNVEDSQVDFEKEIHIHPSTTKYDDTTVYDKHDDNSVDQIHDTTKAPEKVPSDKEDITLRPVFDDQKPMEIDRATTVFSDAESTKVVTMKTKAETTTVSSDDVNKIGVSVLPTDSVDDITPSTPVKECKEQGCKVEAHYTRYPIIGSESTTPRELDVQKCGPYGCEDEEQNIIGSDDAKKPLCGPNGCLTDTQPSGSGDEMLSPDLLSPTHKPEITGIPLEIDSETSTLYEKEPIGDKIEHDIQATTASPSKVDNKDEKCEGDSCSVESVSSSTEKTIESQTQSGISVQEFETTAQKEYATTKSPTVLEKDSTPISEVGVTEKESIDSEVEKGVTETAEEVTYSHVDHSISEEDEKKITTVSSQSYDESSSPQTISSLEIETESDEQIKDIVTEKTGLQTEKSVVDDIKEDQTEHSIYPTSVKPLDESKTQSTDESSATHFETEKPIILEDHTREIVPTTVSILDATAPSDEKVDELDKEQVPSDKTEKPLIHVDSDNEIEQKPVEHTTSDKPIQSETNELSSDLDKSTKPSLDGKITAPGDSKPHDVDESHTEKSHFTETTSEKETIDDSKTTPPSKTTDQKQPEEIDQNIVDLPEILPESTESPKDESHHISPSEPAVTVESVQDQSTSTSDDFEKHTERSDISKDISTERVTVIEDGEIDSEKTTSQVKDTTEEYETHTTEKGTYKPTEQFIEHSTSEPVQSIVTESGEVENTFSPKLSTTTTITHGTTTQPQNEYDSSKTDVPIDDTKKDTLTTVDTIKEEEESYSTAAPHIPSQTDEKLRPSVKDELSPTTVISEETTSRADEVEVHTESIQEDHHKKPESYDHKMDLTERPVVDQTTASILEQATLKQDSGDVDTEKDKELEKPIVEDDLDQKLESYTEKPIHKPSEVEIPHKPKEESTTYHTDILPSHDVTTQLHDDISPETHTEREEIITTRKQFEITIASEETTVGSTDFETTPSQETKYVYSKTTEKTHIESTEKSHDETTLHVDINQTEKEHSTIQSLDHTTVQPKLQPTIPPHPETTEKAQFDELTTQLDTLLPHEESDEDTVSAHHDIGTSPSPLLEDADNLQTTVQTLDTESHKEPVQHELGAETTAHPQVETTVIQLGQDETTHADEKVSEHSKKPEIEVPAISHAESTTKPYDGEMETSQPHSETTVQPQQETTAQPQDESTTKQHAETTIQSEAKTTVQPHTVLDVEAEKDSKPIQTETTVSVQESDATEQPHLSTTLSDQGEFVEPHKDTTHIVPETHDRIPEEDKLDTDGHPQDETPIEPHIPTTLQSILEESTHQPQTETTVHSLAETTVDTKAIPTIVSHDETVPEHVESTSKATIQSTTDYIIDYITSKIPFMEKSTTRPETTSKHTTTEVEEEVPVIDEEDINQEPQMPDPSGSYGTSGQESDYEEEETFGPGTCRYGGKIYVSAQQIPRDDPCDFCFCFRSDIICLQQSCPPPINHCHEEPIPGFCCPRYECPVSMATVLNVTTTTTTTTTTLPPHFLSHAYKGQAQRKGCQIDGHVYRVGEVIKQTSGPCLHCICGADGQMKCDPKKCTPEPMLRQMIAVAATQRRRR